MAELVPAGAVEDDDGVDIIGQGLGEGVEEQPCDPGGDLRQDESEVVAGGRPDGAEEKAVDSELDPAPTEPPAST